MIKNKTTKWFFYILALFIFLINISSGIYANENYISTLFSNNNIQIVQSDDVDTEYPIRANPTSTGADIWLKYRIDNILPYQEDKNRDAYLVYPKAGVIVPVSKISAEDNALINKGESFDHLKYLENWALWYYWDSPSITKWNMVIAAHSSYYKSAPWHYKTIFQALPISNEWDIIQYFEKNSEWNYDLYEYTITSSFQTWKYNTGILEYPNDDKYHLTTYWCYPLWTDTNRRVNQSILTRTIKNYYDIHTVSSSWDENKIHPSSPIIQSPNPVNNYINTETDLASSIEKTNEIINNLNNTIKLIKIDISIYNNTQIDKIDIIR